MIAADGQETAADSDRSSECRSSGRSSSSCMCEILLLPYHTHSLRLNGRGHRGCSAASVFLHNRLFVGILEAGLLLDQG